MKVLAILTFSLLFFSITISSYAQADDPLRPYIDSGEGYGVNPGTNKSKSISEQVKEKQEEIIQKIYDQIFNSPKIPAGSTPRTQTPLATPTPDLAISGSISPQPTSSNSANNESPVPNTDQITGCPSGSTKIQFVGTEYKHLVQQFPCFPLRMFVVHWSASWSSAQATFDVLNERERSCQFAIDDKTTIQMLDFYENAVQQGWCVGGENNIGSISYEITGVYFDDVLKSPTSANYAKLMKMTDTAVNLTCRLMSKYGIPKSAIYGHYELQTGKQDPGPVYLQFFKQKVNASC